MKRHMRQNSTTVEAGEDMGTGQDITLEHASVHHLGTNPMGKHFTFKSKNNLLRRRNGYKYV